jgi:hypothetical protein
MKNIFKIIILLYGFSSFSQTIVEKPLETFFNPDENKHVYFKDVNNILNKYVGTWVFDDGTQYFKIQFYKQTHYRETPIANKKITIYNDRIIGHYQYKLNGVEIYNVTDNKFVYSNNGSFSNGNNIYFREPTDNPCGRRITGEVNLTYFNDNGVEQLTWNRVDFNGGADCYPFDTTPFKTPENMVLTKQ